MKMKITKSNSVFFDLNTKFEDRNHITQIGAVHAASGKKFEKANIKKESQASAIKSFIKWIKRVNNKDPVVLIAHNGLSFDKTVLETVASENGVHKLKNVVAGYADTMVPFRKKFGLKKCSMDDLARAFGKRRDSHDALEDAMLLKKITMEARQVGKVSMNEFFKDAFCSNE